MCGLIYKYPGLKIKIVLYSSLALIQNMNFIKTGTSKYTYYLVCVKQISEIRCSSFGVREIMVTAARGQYPHQN